MNSKVASFSGSLSRGIVGPFHLFALPSFCVSFVSKLVFIKAWLQPFWASIQIRQYLQAGKWTPPWVLLRTRKHQNFLPMKADLLHISLVQTCFMHPRLNHGKGNGTTVLGLDEPGNNPGAGARDRLSLSTSCNHWKKMGVLIDRREWVWRNWTLGGQPLVSAIVQKTSLLKFSCA